MTHAHCPPGVVDDLFFKVDPEKTTLSDLYRFNSIVERVWPDVDWEYGIVWSRDRLEVYGIPLERLEALRGAVETAQWHSKPILENDCENDEENEEMEVNE